MKKYSIIIFVLSILTSTIAFSQEATKRKMPKSPEATFTQQFGESQIMVSYARPMARGRKIFGGLVPFDSLWRTGASDCTTLEFKDFVYIGNKKIEAGKYSLFTIPTATDWTVVLNSETFMHGTAGYKAEKDIHRFKVASMKSERFYETFTIEINDFTTKGDAFLNVAWENTMVKIPLKHEADVAETTPQNPVITTTNAVVEPAHDNHEGHNHVTTTTTAPKKKQTTKAKPTAVMYECPMKCEPPSKTAGTCGKCKMDLKEVKK